MADGQPWLKSAFQAEMRTLVFIFSAKSNRIITRKLWSTKMSQYFAVQNRNPVFFLFIMMDGILNPILQNWKRLFSSIVTSPAVNRPVERAVPQADVSLCKTAFRFY
jgi:hypothetical protein